MIRPLLVSALLLALSGCARDDTVYPSLAQRPVEKLGFAEPEVPAQAAAVHDPALEAEIAGFDKELAAATQGFAADLAATARLAKAAAGRGVGSDAWLDAQSGLATLDARRADTSALLGRVDALLSARAEQLQPDYPGLTGVRDRIDAEATRESEAIARQQAALPAA